MNIICDPGPQTQSQGYIFRNWDLYIIWKLINKLSIYVWFVMIGQYLAVMKLFENLESESKSKYWESCPNEVLSNAYY